MGLLLNTQALIWFRNGDVKALSVKVRTEIEDPQNTSFVSMVSLWEMAIKIRLGTLTFRPAYDDLLALIDQNRLALLPVIFQHTQQLLKLEMHYRDPFDRLLIAQCLIENKVLVTKDRHIPQYPVRCLW
ncbi:type II toxin-antitoxin system VapC family toxin [Larkinella ripae]